MTRPAATTPRSPRRPRPTTMIESTANPKIQLARRVRAGKRRDLLLVEGERGVLEAVRAGLEFELVLATPGAVADLERELAARGGTRHDRVRPLATERKLLASLSDLDAPREAIGIARRPLPVAEDFAAHRVRRLTVYADGVQDPTNLGALARVCAAVGADALLTSPGCAHPNHHRAVRASAFSLLTLPVYPDFAWERLLGTTANLDQVALDGRAATSIYDRRLRHPAAVIIGGEMGIDPRRLAEIDSASIPMHGDVESLNLAVAAGIALFEWMRQDGGR